MHDYYSFHLFIYLLVCLFIYLFICLFIYIFCLFAYLLYVNLIDCFRYKNVAFMSICVHTLLTCTTFVYMLQLLS